MTTRDLQREATRVRILDAAADALLVVGYSAMSTVVVQRTARVSRGALLHHFPTRAQLCEALVAHLVERNEAAVLESLSRLPAELDPVSRAVQALYEALCRPAFRAELELWSAARTDAELLAALRVAERRAGRDLRRVVDDAFGPDHVAQPCYPLVADLTTMLIRGLAVSEVLRSTDRAARQLIDDWAALAREIFRQQLVPAHHSSLSTP